MECQWWNDVSWANPDDHHRADVLSRKCLQLIELKNANRYHWTTVEIVETSFVLNTINVIIQTNITIGNPLDWPILPIGLDERVCNSFEGCSVPMYACFFTRLWICLPLSKFEVAMMNNLKFHPCNFILELRLS